MASKIKLTNANGINSEVTLINPDSNLNRKKDVDISKLTTYVDTVDDLASLTSAVGTVIVSDKDRGGIFNAIASTTANDGTIFDGSGCSWERQYEGAVNVKWFGAVGDGITDDTAILQLLIDTFNEIELGDNFYGITSLVLKSYTKIKGNGILRSGFISISNGYILTTDNNIVTEALELRDFSINGNGFNGDGLVLDLVKYSTYYNLFVYGCVGAGIAIGTSGDKAPDGSIYNYFYGIQSTDNIYGVRIIDYANATSFFGGRIAGNTSDGITFENNINKPNGCLVTGISFENNGGFAIDFSGRLSSFISNRIEQNSSGGIRFNSDAQLPTLVGNSYHTQTNPIQNNIVAGSLSPCILELQNGIELNTTTQINGFNDELKITGVQGISSGSIQSKNMVIRGYSVTLNATSINVPLPNTEDDNNYLIFVTPNWFTTVAQGTRTTTTAGIQFGTPAPSNAKVDIFIVR